MKDKQEIYLVPYSHLDTQWRWEYPTTINKYLKKTLNESIALFEKYPEHCFNFTGALRYAMMKEYFPEQFAEVKRLVAADRWHPAGTCLDETDALVPSSESLIRNILYGDRWQRNELGSSSRDYMIPDCFGFPTNMPTLLSHCGIIGFSTNKLTWGSAVGIPFEIGIWKGPDGSEIVSALNPCRYNSHLELPVFLNPGRLARLRHLGKKNGIWKSFQYYGVGDIGGAPLEGSVRRALASIRHYRKKKGVLTVRQGSADQFFSNITEAEKSLMDRYQGDFLLTNHSAGTITSAAIMKRWNRKNEQLAYAAEAAAVTALVLTGRAYPAEKIKSAWRRIIGSQMHDILPGTSTPTAYEYSHNDEVLALKTWSTVLEDSAAAVAEQQYGELLLFNPLAESRKELVEVQLPAAENFTQGSVLVTDSSGGEFPGLIRCDKKNSYILTFMPQLLPLSWTGFSLKKQEHHGKNSLNTAVSLSTKVDYYYMENIYYCVTVSSKGAVTSIVQKNGNRELLKKPLAYEFQKERPMLFPSWNMDWRDRKRSPFARIEDGTDISIIENTALRVKLQVRTDYGASRFIKEISLSAGSDLVEFTERITWRESGCSLKIAFTSALDQPVFTCNWETSRITRNINNKNIFEMPSRMWTDLSDKENGFSIIEDSKFGWDRPDRNTVRMTLLYTPALRFINGFRDQKYQDWGEHTVRYGILGHQGDWHGTDVRARAFNLPVRSFYIHRNSRMAKGTLPPLLTLSTPQVGLMALKKMEDAESLLIRLYERYGKECRAAIFFMLPIEEVLEVNGLEETVRNIDYSGNSFNFAIGADSVLAFAVKFKEKRTAKASEQQQLDLDCNYNLISKNNKQGSALFPEELMPPRITAGSLCFEINRHREKNALQLSGQTLLLPAGINTLSMLTGASESCEIIVQWLNAKGSIIKFESCLISSLSTFAGQWDRRIWKRKPKHHLKQRRDYIWLNKCIGVDPGYINRNRIEWYSTHIHENGKDCAYQYGYLYNTTLNIPAGADSLRLPSENRVFIVAATVHQQELMAENSTVLQDAFDF